MTLLSGDLGSKLSWPVGYVPRSQAHIRSGNGGRLSFTPTLLYHQQWVNPAAADDEGYSAAHAGASSAGTTSQTLAGALAGVADYARNVVITVTHASSVVAMSGVITGTDIWGRVITEAWAVTATGTSKVFTGKKAFKTVTSITEVVAANASANTIKSGTGVVLGLKFKNASVQPLGEMQDGAVPTAGVLVVASTASTADYLGTYAPNAAPDGAKDYDVFYLVDDPVTVQP